MVAICGLAQAATGTPTMLSQAMIAKSRNFRPGFMVMDVMSGA